jgi:hypothetical protein
LRNADALCYETCAVGHVPLVGSQLSKSVER